MKVYSYDKITKELIGAFNAELDPLETKRQNKNVWILPANSTFDIPPDPEVGKTAVYGGAWDNVIDNRGSKYFLAGDVTEYVIKNLAEDFPDGYLTEVDPVAANEKAQEAATFKRYNLRSELQHNLTVTALGKDWDFSIESLILFNGSIALGLPFPWRPKGETYQDLSIDDAKTIGVALSVKIKQIDQASENDKAAILALDYSLTNLNSLKG